MTLKLIEWHWMTLIHAVHTTISQKIAVNVKLSHWQFFPKQFTVGVLNAVLSVSALAGVLCPPRKACLLSPNLSPTWLCLSPWVGCCVRLAGLVSQFVSQFVSHLALSPSFLSPFVSHLALSFTLAGVLCPPRWACLRFCLLICLPICLPLGFVFHLGWGAVSASLGLSPNLSPTWLCLSPWLGCCVRLAGLVSQFVTGLAPVDECIVLLYFFQRWFV